MSWLRIKRWCKSQCRTCGKPIMRDHRFCVPCVDAHSNLIHRLAKCFECDKFARCMESEHIQKACFDKTEKRKKTTGDSTND